MATSSPDSPDAMRGPGSMRRANEWAVLARLYGREPASAPQLAAGTGLSRPTVNLALANLAEGGLIRQSGVRSGRAGRAARLFEADPGAGAVVSVDVGARWIRLLLADVTGAVLARRRERSRADDAGRLVRQIAGLLAELLTAHAVPPEAVLALVVGSPGFFDPAEQRIRLASHLPGWDRPSMVDLLSAELGGLAERVDFENDVDLAALGEREHGLGRGVPDFVFVSVGSGIGMGTVIDGRLHRGAHGAAGEIAFLPIGDVGPGTRLPGALESAAAADAVVAAARREGVPDAGSAAEVFDAARDGHAAALRVVRRHLDHLARALLSVMATIDPRLVVLGGGMGANSGFLLEELRTRLAELTPLPLPDLAVSAVGDDAPLLGGLANGAETARARAFARYTGG